MYYVICIMGIYDELSEKLNEENKELVPCDYIVNSNESSFKEVKPLDLFDDTREGGPGNVQEAKLEDTLMREPTDEFPVRERNLVEFSFGKNGQGITDEFIKIGNRIRTLTEKNYIYLVDARMDSLDDVYDLIFEIHERD